MSHDTFEIKVNEDAKRYEFTPKVPGYTSYTVSFEEVSTVEDACIAVWKAIQKGTP